MRFSFRTFLLLIALVSIATPRLHSGRPPVRRDVPLPDPYDPGLPDDLPPLPDPFDLPNDPPDTFDNPFDPNDLPPLPDPFDDPFPPETDLPPLPDPFDLPDPPDLPDPFDDMVPSLFPDPIDDLPDPFDDLPPLPDLPIPGEDGQARPGAHLATPRATPPAGTATNIPAKLMPFPRPILFPVHLTVSAGATKPPCDPNFSSTVLIPEANSNTLAFLATCPPAVTMRVVVGNGPVSVTVARDGKNAWVANSVDGTVSVVNLASMTVTQTIPLTAPDGSPPTPNQTVFLPNGTLAYVSDHYCNDDSGSYIFMIDTSTYQTVGTIPTGCYPSSMAMTPDGAQLWVSQHDSERVDVYDTLSNKDLFGFSIQYPLGIGFNPSGTFAYIASGTGPGYIEVVNMQTYQLVTQIPVGNEPHVVAVTPTGKHVFVTNLGDVTISQIDTATSTVLRTLPLPNGDNHPLGLTFIH